MPNLGGDSGDYGLSVATATAVAIPGASNLDFSWAVRKV